MFQVQTSLYNKHTLKKGTLWYTGLKKQGKTFVEFTGRSIVPQIHFTIYRIFINSSGKYSLPSQYFTEKKIFCCGKRNVTVLVHHQTNSDTLMKAFEVSQLCFLFLSLVFEF